MTHISPADILEDLREGAEQLEIDLSDVDINAASSLENDLGMDSLNIMDFLVLLEKKYQVKITDEKLRDMETVSDIVAVLNAIRSGAGGPVAAPALAGEPDA